MAKASALLSPKTPESEPALATPILGPLLVPDDDDAAQSDTKAVTPLDDKYKNVLAEIFKFGQAPSLETIKLLCNQQNIDFNTLLPDTKNDTVIIIDPNQITPELQNQLSFCQQFLHNLKNPGEDTALGTYESALRDNSWGYATSADTNILGVVTSEPWGIMGQQFNQAAGSTMVMVAGAVPIVLLYKAQGKEPPYELLLRIIVAASLAIIPWNSAFAIVFGTWTFSPAIGAWSIFLDPKIHLACFLTGQFETATQNLAPKIFVKPFSRYARGEKNQRTNFLKDIFSLDTLVGLMPQSAIPGASWAYAWLVCALAGQSPTITGYAISATVFIFNYLIAGLNPVILDRMDNCNKKPVKSSVIIEEIDEKSVAKANAPIKADALVAEKPIAAAQPPKSTNKKLGWGSWCCTFLPACCRARRDNMEERLLHGQQPK